jgi:endoglucanase
MNRLRYRAAVVIVTLVILLVGSSLGIARAVQQLGRLSQNTSNQAVNPLSTFPPTSTPPSQSAIALSVHGTQLVNGKGQSVTLIGVDHSSFEYSCTGDGHFESADYNAMKQWGINAIRIPLSSEFWANHGNTCPLYRQLVADAIAKAEAAGLYVIVDLQWDAPFDTPEDRLYGGLQCPMPDYNQDVDFWRDIATQYKNDPHILFDLFGEPHDISWSTWYHGGALVLTQKSNCALIQSNPVNSRTEYGSYQAVGMADLAQIVRSLAPKNIIIIPGINWGYDLSGIAPNYLIQQTNVIYDTHPFDYSGKQPSNWAHDFGDFAQHYAVIASEFGAYQCQTSYPEQAVAFFEEHHISFLAWTWGVYGGPGSQCAATGNVGPFLLADWSGTPSVPYGAAIQSLILTASGK